MVRKQTASGVSIGIKTTMESYHKGEQLIEKQKPAEFTIKFANCLEEREEAYRLAYHVYLEKDFIQKNGNEWLVQPYDASSETVTLIVLDSQKKVAGTLTILFEESLKLPAEKLYKEELNNLRKKTYKIAETSRLAISQEYRNSKEILVLLYNYMFIYIYYVKNYDYLAIQVNPRHKNYYKSLMCYDEIGAEKPCPLVQNAPAVLLSLSKERYQSELIRCSKNSNEEKRDRTLYPHFVKAEQERLVAHYLEKQMKPMSKEEKIYFGFTDTEIGQALHV